MTTCAPGLLWQWVDAVLFGRRHGLQGNSYYSPGLPPSDTE